MIPNKDCINIPVKLLDWAKDDPIKWSASALFVMIKAMRVHSCYLFESVNRFRKDFGVNSKKADTLISALEEGLTLDDGRSMCEMFTRGVPVRHIKVYSFKRLFKTRKFDKRNREIYTNLVIQVKRSDIAGKRLFNVERMLRVLLLKNTINAHNSGHNKSLKAGSSASSCTSLSQKVLSNGIGRSERTVRRMTRALKSQGELSVDPGRLVTLCSDISHEPVTAKWPIIIGHMAFTRLCNSYSWSKATRTGSIRHIIYNCEGRNGSAASKASSGAKSVKTCKYCHLNSQFD